MAIMSQHSRLLWGYHAIGVLKDYGDLNLYYIHSQSFTYCNISQLLHITGHTTSIHSLSIHNHDVPPILLIGEYHSM